MNSKKRNILDKSFKRLGFSAVLLPVLLLAACNKNNVQAAGPTAPPAPLVTVVQTSAQDVPRYLDESGKNGAYQSVTVTPQVGGRIVERHFQDGENLRKGQLLFVIDPRPYKAQLDSAQANLARQRRPLNWPRSSFHATRKSSALGPFPNRITTPRRTRST